VKRALPCIVQFIHPGSEHGGGLNPWNTGKHRRKFLRSRGSYVDAADAVVQTEELVFWGEWEPQSEAVPVANPLQDGPRWIHLPYYVVPASYPGNLQNTDPFVFGDAFQYTLCRQMRRTAGQYRPTSLRDLAQASLILFGSLRHGGFVLDTVLVVGESVLHDAQNWSTVLARRISDTYAAVTMLPTYQTAWPHPLRLYSGATFAKPVDEIFSFVPCLPAARAPKGFVRPIIRLDGIITPGLMMGAKVTHNLALGEIKQRWDTVVAQVREQNLALGVRFDLPPRRTA